MVFSSSRYRLALIFYTREGTQSFFLTYSFFYFIDLHC